MITDAQVEETIFRALAALNAERASDDQIPISASTPLLRDDAQLDSLELVSLISEVETTLSTDFGLDVSLADERAFARPASPYGTVETLRRFVLELAEGS